MEVTQNDRTNQLYKRITQGKMTSHSRMGMMNDTFGCSRATQVCMEDLRQVSLTEKCLSRRDLSGSMLEILMYFVLVFIL